MPACAKLCHDAELIWLDAARAAPRVIVPVPTVAVVIPARFLSITAISAPSIVSAEYREPRGTPYVRGRDHLIKRHHSPSSARDRIVVLEYRNHSPLVEIAHFSLNVRAATIVLSYTSHYDVHTGPEYLLRAPLMAQPGNISR